LEPKLQIYFKVCLICLGCWWGEGRAVWNYNEEDYECRSIRHPE